MSDTHYKHRGIDKLPEGDMIIHAGDISERGQLNQVKDFLDWFHALPYKYKVFIAGNHDFSFENDVIKIQIKDMLAEYPDIIYLENESVIIEGIKIYGSPYTPRFYDWAFNVDRGKPIAEEWAKIPDDTNILITHGPPLNYGDVTARGQQVGCKDLLYRVLQIKPVLHIFGHIHEGRGMYSNDHTTFVNASVLDENYFLVHDPIVIDYKDFI